MSERERFLQVRRDLVASYPGNETLRSTAASFMVESIRARYSYNFDWAGRPIIQYPQDIVALQELVWELKPDLIVECGIAHGGSLILSASMLAMNAYCEAAATGAVLDTSAPTTRVLGASHAPNRAAVRAIDMVWRASSTWASQ